jgi:hypothetical protein
MWGALSNERTDLYDLAWFRHYATSRKVAVSIPDDLTGIFSWSNASSRNMFLGSSQPLTEIRYQESPWG